MCSRVPTTATGELTLQGILLNLSELFNFLSRETSLVEISKSFRKNKDTILRLAGILHTADLL